MEGEGDGWSSSTAILRAGTSQIGFDNTSVATMTECVGASPCRPTHLLPTEANRRATAKARHPSGAVLEKWGQVCTLSLSPPLERPGVSSHHDGLVKITGVSKASSCCWGNSQYHIHLLQQL